MRAGRTLNFFDSSKQATCKKHVFSSCLFNSKSAKYNLPNYSEICIFILNIKSDIRSFKNKISTYCI